ncbi:MAG: hypothetical protein OJJ54_09665 [Pseudonocardia sp.]|nr:hypothetical protein [Pseudonocardia sp.]
MHDPLTEALPDYSDPPTEPIRVVGKPVFVDGTGRRGRRARTAAYLFAAVCASMVTLTGVSVLAGQHTPMLQLPFLEGTALGGTPDALPAGSALPVADVLGAADEALASAGAGTVAPTTANGAGPVVLAAGTVPGTTLPATVGAGTVPAPPAAGVVAVPPAAAPAPAVPPVVNLPAPVVPPAPLPEGNPDPAPPATQPPATQPPVTQPPVTQPPVTQPPATQPPATQPPVTQPPATQPPATQPPATQPPVTQPPATQPPVTQPPATQPPATLPPTGPSVPA